MYINVKVNVIQFYCLHMVILNFQSIWSTQRSNFLTFDSIFLFSTAVISMFKLQEKKLDAYLWVNTWWISFNILKEQ